MVWPNAGRRHSLQCFGIPIRVHASWFLVVVFVAWTLARRYFPSEYAGLSVRAYWAMGAVAALLLFACVLLHELGHAFAARGLGIPVTGITLFIFGGVAQIAHGARRPSAELKVALAGPLVSLLIAGACFLAGPAMPRGQAVQIMAVAIVRYLAVINMALLVFNLLPGFPLDGGRVMRAAIWAWTGDLLRATRITGAIGSLIGLGLMGLGGWLILQDAWSGGMWYLLLGFFLRDAARASVRQAE